MAEAVTGPDTGPGTADQAVSRAGFEGCAQAVQARAGAAFVVPFQVPVKPNVVVPFAATAPLYGMFVTVTAEPDVATVPLHSWVIVWPLANVQPTVHRDIGAFPAFTVTDAWNPPGEPGHWLVTVYVAVQAPPAGGAVVGGAVVGGAVVGGAVVGGRVVGGAVLGGAVVGGRVVGGAVVGPPLPVGGIRYGPTMFIFAWLTVFQSSLTMPPVSPESGFHDQYVKDIPLTPLPM